jgi:hypothetical protein
MVGVTASLVIAGVTKHFTFGNWTDMVLVRPLMGSGSFTKSVSIFANAELPNPAVSFKFNSLFPVAFHDFM